jgi:hypothetical protein
MIFLWQAVIWIRQGRSSRRWRADALHLLEFLAMQGEGREWVVVV